jgi:hypothetical protein
MAVPLLAPAAAAAAAAAPAAAAEVGGGAILRTLLTGLLSGAAEGAIQSATAPGALTPSPAQGGSGSKFMITLQDVKEIQRYVNEENYRRGIFRPDLPLLNAEEIIAEREAELRRSAAEAGAREYAIKQLDVEAATRPAVAGALGAATVGAQQALADAIESITSRPKYESSPVLAEIGRAI